MPKVLPIATVRGRNSDIIGFFSSSAVDKSELLDEDASSLTSSDPASSALLASGQEEQEIVDADKYVETESSQPSSPAYAELLEVIEGVHCQGSVDRCFLWSSLVLSLLWEDFS